MKKIICGIAAAMLLAGIVYAETGITDDESKNLEELSKKLVRMKREMNKFIKDVSATYPDQESTFAGLGESDVKIDVSENSSTFIVRADLPGMAKDKIEVTLDRGKTLKIAGTREALKSETAPGVVKQERSYGHFERTLELPGEGMSEGINASYKDGVLEIVIPKKELSKDEKIKISVQ